MTYAETIAPFVDRCHYGDARQVLDTLPEASAHCVVTSPPYWLQRDYGVEGQLGLEATPDEYVAKLVEVFREVRRVLRDDGTLWLNLGDSYGVANNRNSGARQTKPATNTSRDDALAFNSGTYRSLPGLKPKDLIGVPWRVAFALQADGWWLRSDIIWNKPNPMPESVTDRPTRTHEHVFLLAKSARYFYDADAVREAGVYSGPPKPGHRAEDGYPGQIPRAGNLGRPAETGRNLRDVWTITTKPYAAAHFAVFPPEIPKRCIQAGTSERGACAECGAPWERVVERTTVRQLADQAGTWTERPGAAGYGKAAGSSQRADARSGLSASNSHNAGTPQSPRIETTGWRPTCDHDAPAVPCVVLDPFLGSGATAMVAQDLGRRWLGCELNPEYAPLIDKRTAQLGLFAAVRP
jgi:DNA modification methylase